MGKVLAEVVVTGGSAAGKTEAGPRIRRWAVGKPFRVLCVPETASIVIDATAPDIAEIASTQPDIHYALERAMYTLHLQLRQHMLNMAKAFTEPVLIIYDRGEMDVSTYMTREQFSETLIETGLGLSEVRDKYSAVIHLETCAKRVPQYYNYDNPARWETPRQAITADAKIVEAWGQHPNHRVIVGQEDFENKMQEMLHVLDEVVKEAL